MTSREIPQIGVVSVAKRGEVSVPTASDIESRINYFLGEKGKRVFSSGSHELIALDATAPHHPDGSVVYWVNRINRDASITPWGENGWEGVLLDKQFIESLEQSIHIDQSENSEYRWVMHYGFTVPEQTAAGEKIIKRGLQSHARMHLHRVKNIEAGYVPNRVLSTEYNSTDALFYSLVLNEAGERAVRYYQPHLRLYGQQIGFSQPLGKHGLYEHNRTLYGFESLYCALTKSYEVRGAIMDTWSEVTSSLVEESFEFHGISLDLFQSSIPNFSVVLPSEKDREIFQIDTDATVCVFPFTICNSQSYLTPGGVFIDHVSTR